MFHPCLSPLNDLFEKAWKTLYLVPYPYTLWLWVTWAVERLAAREGGKEQEGCSRQ